MTGATESGSDCLFAFVFLVPGFIPQTSTAHHQPALPSAQGRFLVLFSERVSATIAATLVLPSGEANLIVDRVIGDMLPGLLGRYQPQARHRYLEEVYDLGDCHSLFLTHHPQRLAHLLRPLKISMGIYPRFLQIPGILIPSRSCDNHIVLQSYLILFPPGYVIIVWLST